MDVLDDFLRYMDIENERKKIINDISTLRYMNLKVDRVVVNTYLFREVNKYAKYLDVEVDIDDKIETYSIIHREKTWWEKVKSKFR